MFRWLLLYWTIGAACPHIDTVHAAASNDKLSLQFCVDWHKMQMELDGVHGTFCSLLC